MGLLQFKRLESEGIPVFKLLREQFGLSRDSVEEYLKSINGTRLVLDLLRQALGKAFGGSDSDWEDHIVPIINGKIIDFTYTNEGVSHKVRKVNTIPPMIVDYNISLFKPNGIYGKYGYTNPEKNTEYGNLKDINQFQVSEPNKKVGG